MSEEVLGRTVAPAKRDRLAEQAWKVTSKVCLDSLPALLRMQQLLKCCHLVADEAEMGGIKGQDGAWGERCAW